MVCHSLSNENYPEHMENFEFSRYEISKVYFNGQLVDHIEAVLTITYINNPHLATLDRAEIISSIRKGDGFYLDGQKLHLDVIDGKPFIHKEISTSPMDIV